MDFGVSMSYMRGYSDIKHERNPKSCIFAFFTFYPLTEEEKERIVKYHALTEEGKELVLMFRTLNENEKDFIEKEVDSLREELESK